MKMTSEKCRIVSKNEVVIQTGERRGEVVFRLAVADGEGTLTDIQAKIEPDVYKSLELFGVEYDCVFDYSMRTFNGKAYASFCVVDIFKSGKTVKAAN